MYDKTEGRHANLAASTAELAALLGTGLIRELTDEEMEFVVGGDNYNNNGP